MTQQRIIDRVCVKKPAAWTTVNVQLVASSNFAGLRYTGQAGVTINWSGIVLPVE